MNQQEKDAILAQLRAHREADQLVKGQYWSEGKGCAVGCIAHKSYDEGVHAAVADMLGVPEQVAHLIDAIFEGLPNADAMAWPERVVSAIVPDADHSLAWSRFAVRLLVDPDFGVIHTTDKADVRAAIEGVARCYRRRINGDEPTEAEWNAAGNAARAAWAAREAWAAGAARAARAAWAARCADWLVEILSTPTATETVA